MYPNVGKYNINITLFLLRILWEYPCTNQTTNLVLIEAPFAGTVIPSVRWVIPNRDRR